MRLQQILVALLLAVSFSSELAAQTTVSGGLAGIVTDPSKAVVPDADVVVRGSAKGTTQTTKTDRQGVYQFFFLSPGRYMLTVTHVGFRDETRVVNVLLGPPVSANVSLAIARVSTNVTVSDEAPLIRAENGDVSATVGQKQISEIPNPGNDLTYIAQTTPGVVMNTETSFAVFSSLGMPGTSNLFTVDGMNQNETASNTGLTGASNLMLGQNQIQEATVVSIGYSGQFGGAAGANVNYITKSGGNDFHGNGQYFWNGPVFNANDWFNNAFQQRRPFSIANQWAGSLGGPLRKNKLFFFFDTEGIRVLLPQSLFVVIPSPQFETATIRNIDSKFGPASASDAFYKKIFSLYNDATGADRATSGNFEDPLGCRGFSDQPTGLGISVPCASHFFTTRGIPTTDTLTSGRVDWSASDSDRAFLRVQYDAGHNPVYTDPISPLFDFDRKISWWQSQLVETHTFGSSAAGQFLLAASYYDLTEQLTHFSEALAAFPTALFFGSDIFSPLALLNSGPVDARPATRYQVAADVVKTRGNHKFGFGGNLQRIYWTSRLYGLQALGILTVQTLDAFYQGGVDPVSPDRDFTWLNQSFAAGESQRISFYDLGLYSQYEWRARPNLALTLALRAEHSSNPVCQRRCFARIAGTFGSVSYDPNQPYSQGILVDQEHAFASSDKVLWGPRFSFAWQPLGPLHNTVIRGGIGVFYNPVPTYLAVRLSGNPPQVNNFAIIGDNMAPGEQTNLFTDAAASNKAFVDGFGKGKSLAQIQATVPHFSPPGLVTPGQRIHSPQYQRWSLELQQAFGADTTVGVGYFGHHGIHEFVQDPNENAYGFGSLPARLCASPPIPPCADPRFRDVAEAKTDAVSNYNGMIVSFRHRFSRWSEGLLEASYTYSHAFDEVSSGGHLDIGPQDPNNLRGAYGSAEYDVRHSLNASYVWDLPVKAALGGHGPDSLVSGWQVSGTIFARTGFPYTVFDSFKSGSLISNNYFGPIYAVPVGPLQSGNSCGAGAAFPLIRKPCQPPQLLADGTTPNPNARFVQAGCETGFNTGNLPAPSGPCDGAPVTFPQGRNRFRGPHYFNTDFAIMKRTKIPRWENAMLGIGFQFFNFFNHPNFGLPEVDISSPDFGAIGYLDQPPTSILGAGLGGDVSPRMIQLKVQLQF